MPALFHGIPGWGQKCPLPDSPRHPLPCHLTHFKKKWYRGERKKFCGCLRNGCEPVQIFSRNQTRGLSDP